MKNLDFNNIFSLKLLKRNVSVAIFFSSLLSNSVRAQTTVKQYSKIINDQLTTLLQQVANSNNSSSQFKKDVYGVSDLFYTYDSELLNSPLDSNDLNNDEEVIMDLKNYHQVLSYYLDDSILRNDTLLNYMKKDLIIKTASNLALEDYSTFKRVKLKIKVMNKKQTDELPGYDVFISPYASLDPLLKKALNPTNNAVTDTRPGNKKVSIYLNGNLVENKEVQVYYKENSAIQTVIFIVK